jgi:hypothetical protein
MIALIDDVKALQTKEQNGFIVHPIPAFSI